MELSTNNLQRDMDTQQNIPIIISELSLKLDIFPKRRIYTVHEKTKSNSNIASMITVKPKTKYIEYQYKSHTFPVCMTH